MRPCPGPREPVAGAGLASDHGQAEQVVQAAAVDPDVDHLAALEERIELQPAGTLALPEVRAGPTVRAQREADLYVQVLRRPAPQLLLAARRRLLVVRHQALDRDRPASVRRDHVPVGRVAPVDVRRELVEQRQDRRDQAPIADRAGLLQLGAEHARWWPLGLRGDRDQESLRLRDQAAAQLADHAVRVVRLGDHVQLVQQHAGWLRARHNFRVERLDLQEGSGRAVGQLLQVLLHVEAGLELRVRLDHADRLRVGQVRDLLRRRDQQELGPRAPAHQHGRQHDRRARRRLAVLLRHELEDLANVPNAGLRIVGAEQRPHDVALPVARGFGQERPARHVRQLQAVEDGDRAIGLGGDQRQRRQ